MKAILAVAFLAFLCAAPAGCFKPKPPESATVDSPGYQDARVKARKFNELMNTGFNCLELCKDIEVRKTLLIQHSAYDSPEMQDLVNKQMKLLQQADGSFREALRMDQSSMAAHQALCQVLVRLGRYDEAIEHGLLVLKNAPARMAVYRDVAVAYERKGYNSQGAESIKNYEEAVRTITEYYPKDTDAISQAQMVAYLGEICYERLAEIMTGPDRIKQYEKIIDVLGNYLKDHPDNPFADEMKTRVDAAREGKADFESGYGE
jgi:tetratricopeptide (TPR) repeat protein